MAIFQTERHEASSNYSNTEASEFKAKKKIIEEIERETEVRFCDGYPTCLTFQDSLCLSTSF